MLVYVLILSFGASRSSFLDDFLALYSFSYDEQSGNLARFIFLLLPLILCLHVINCGYK